MLDAYIPGAGFFYGFDVQQNKHANAHKYTEGMQVVAHENTTEEMNTKENEPTDVGSLTSYKPIACR